MAGRLFLAAFMLLAWPAQAETWMLFGRHGGCTSLAEMAKREPIFEGVASPEELRAKLRLQGAEFTYEEHTYEEHTADGQRVVMVKAPALGLAIALVPKSFCER